MAEVQPISQEQAEQALAAVKEQFKIYLSPLVIPADEHGPERTYPPDCPEPTLSNNWGSDGHWYILWEEGPDEWAHRAACGGFSEEEYDLQAAASKEFGVAVLPPKQEAPVKFPEGVYGEPYYSFVLGLYPA